MFQIGLQKEPQQEIRSLSKPWTEGTLKSRPQCWSWLNLTHILHNSCKLFQTAVVKILSELIISSFLHLLISSNHMKSRSPMGFSIYLIKKKPKKKKKKKNSGEWLFHCLWTRKVNISCFHIEFSTCMKSVFSAEVLYIWNKQRTICDSVFFFFLLALSC